MKSSTFSLLPTDQFRMTKLQVHNWGTFSGLHTIPISKKGFLFVGPSGSGKSTLLDGFSSLLIPPRWIDFNAAAREAEKTGRDRSLVTYVRGAWGEQKDEDSGLIGMRFLRTETTWSALALSFSNEEQKHITLVQIFWMRGKSTSTSDIKRLYLIFERAFDLDELRSFDLDVRKLKASFPEAFCRDEFSSYGERFRRLLGIESEMALRLLHKTQSAKNLGDLNEFLRHFMLDKPETFDAADRMVTEFAELNAAHQTVVTVRDQIQTLKPAREDHLQWKKESETVIQLNELKNSIDPFTVLTKIDLLVKKDRDLQARVEGARDALDSASHASNIQQENLERLKQHRRDAGGMQIEIWENEKTKLQGQRPIIQLKREKLIAACLALGCHYPKSATDFSSILSNAMKESEAWSLSSENDEQLLINLNQEKSDLEKEFVAVSDEVRALETQPSNIPSKFIRLRNEIAQGIGVPESAFPFVGELIEVRSEESLWQGAIERALRGFALSILIDERYYSEFSTYVNSHYLGQKLVYYRTNDISTKSERRLSQRSMIHKLKIKEGAHEHWLNSELEKRFDYVCAESMSIFRSSEYAITQDGQMKLGKSRHEKDDNYHINDGRRWVLGFNNASKLDLYRGEAQELAIEIEKLKKKIDELKQERLSKKNRFTHSQTIVNLKWSEIDIDTLDLQISQIDGSLKEAKSRNQSLQKIDAQISKQEDEVKKANSILIKATASLNTIATDITSNSQNLKRQQARLDGTSINEAQNDELRRRLSEIDSSPSIDNIDETTREILQDITDDIDTARKRLNQLEKNIEKCFLSFKQRWPLEAADVDAKIISAPDFFSKLNRLENDGLPDYEEKFFELLRNQSHENLAALSTHMNQTRKEISARLELVNSGLQTAPFNPGTYLKIQSVDRQLPEVQEFKQAVQHALSNAWGQDDRESAEVRFLTLKKLVERLASENSPDRRWRELVLDVRLHVEFIGRELDESGKEAETYRSGSGKSGGQRQKLATTCLAAALRYQLGGYERGFPVYAPVILDEAFDKADNEFTALAMNIFSNFGFQMIVATPLKSVMTLEPFIGGACIVGIKERKHSGILLVEYDFEKECLKLPDRKKQMHSEEVE